MQLQGFRVFLRVKIDAGRLRLNLLPQIASSLREYAIDQIEQF
jgi:hypothetical protein